MTRKITLGAANIKLGRQRKLYLGNLEAKRDWGYSPEYVEGIWRMLQLDHPGDYVLATGETHSVHDFLEAAFEHVGIDWRKCVGFDPLYLRPTEVDSLVGDYSKARDALGWEPRTRMVSLAQLMVNSDLTLLSDERPQRFQEKLSGA